MFSIKPNMYCKDIYSINYSKLKDMNMKYLFFDLDNTIIKYNENDLNIRIINLFNKLQKMGFECFIFSNSSCHRLENIKNKLHIDVYCSSMKPFKKNYINVINKYNKNQCVFIGDQIMTDVIGAKRNDLFVIFVDKIDNDEPFYTRFLRMFEKIILIRMNKKNILVKGNYYE